MDLDQTMLDLWRKLSEEADKPQYLEIKNWDLVHDLYVAGRLRMYRNDEGRLCFESTPDGPVPDGDLGDIDG